MLQVDNLIGVRSLAKYLSPKENQIIILLLISNGGFYISEDELF